MGVSRTDPTIGYDHPGGSATVVPDVYVRQAQEWFRRRTYHHSRFADVQGLLDAKERRGVSISVAIPTIMEGGTIGPIVEAIRRELVERVPLVDEVVVIDSASTDGTVERAARAGAVVFQDADIAPETGLLGGKGDALWKSLFVLKGDLIVWVDADIRDFTSRFVLGPLGPLLLDEEVRYVKAFYRRPIRQGGELAPTGGGRVTELVARPVLNLLFPWLSTVVQPLSGEYAGTREALESVPFITGYGVELGLLVDISDRFGLDAIAQVDLDRRVHRNRPIEQLSRMSFEILQAAFLRLRAEDRGVLRDDLNLLFHQFGEPDGSSHEADLSFIRVQERPPAITVPGYREPVIDGDAVPV